MVKVLGCAGSARGAALIISGCGSSTAGDVHRHVAAVVIRPGAECQTDLFEVVAASEAQHLGLVRAAKAGNTEAATIAMMAITTINSTRVKATFGLSMFFISGGSFSEVSGFHRPDKTFAVELLECPPSTGEGR